MLLTTKIVARLFQVANTIFCLFYVVGSYICSLHSSVELMLTVLRFDYPPQHVFIGVEMQNGESIYIRSWLFLCYKIFYVNYIEFG